MDFPGDVLCNRVNGDGAAVAWSIDTLYETLAARDMAGSKRTVERAVQADGLLPPPLDLDTLRDEKSRPIKTHVAASLLDRARKERRLSFFVQFHVTPDGRPLLAANDGRQARRWVFLDPDNRSDEDYVAALHALADDPKRDLLIWPHGPLSERLRGMVDRDDALDETISVAFAAYHAVSDTRPRAASQAAPPSTSRLTHLDRLEAEAMHIMREVAATAEKPVMLYSIGKDSAAMLHVARKAFYPAPPPFPLLHVDTRWKFQEMYQFRDRMAAEAGMDLIVHINPDGVKKDINPFDHGSAVHTDIMKTQGLKQALAQYGFDVAFGGARRDEEKSRAKERIFSFRTAAQRWDPKNQRPELWSLYNTAKHRDESIRVFPLSNWTELDVWQYIHREAIPIVPLYLAKTRPVIERDGMLLMADDDRLKPEDDETIGFRKIRFRTLGCYPLTGAIESEAEDLDAVILELIAARTSERQGRAIDSDSNASMEHKKQEGYF